MYRKPYHRRPFDRHWLLAAPPSVSVSVEQVASREAIVWEEQLVSAESGSLPLGAAIVSLVVNLGAFGGGFGIAG